MKKEFNLSEKIYYIDNKPDVIRFGDVKEFIKRAKKEAHIDLGGDFMIIRYSKFKELAGDELSKEIEG